MVLRRARRILQIALVGVLPGAVSGPARAEYIIRPGDVLEISVAGIPELKQRSVVDIDGSVTLPLISPFAVGGLDLRAIQIALKEELSKKLYQQRTPAGAESITAITPDAVTVSVAEYRPIYLNGDVSKPGEHAYRPGMTVRQAVSLAGGYEIMRFRMINPFLESADLRNEYQTLWMQYVKQQGRLWRIKAQLAAPGGPEAPAASEAGIDLDLTADLKLLEQLTQAPLSREYLDRTRENSRHQLEADRTRYQKERSFLQRTLSVADSQIALLRSRQLRDDENAQADTADYNRLKEFSERGNLPMTRLSEARRLFLFSATQSLQTGVQLTSTIRERDDVARRLVRLEEQTRSDLLKEIDEASIDLGALKSKLQATSEKIAYTGMIRSQLKRSGNSKLSIIIVRSSFDGGSSEAASENSVVRPGDTVEVALNAETSQ